MTKRDKGDKTNEIEIKIIERHVIKICFQQEFKSEFRIFVASKFSKRIIQRSQGRAKMTRARDAIESRVTCNVNFSSHILVTSADTGYGFFRVILILISIYYSIVGTGLIYHHRNGRQQGGNGHLSLGSNGTIL
jgi:hypothetical protein